MKPLIALLVLGLAVTSMPLGAADDAAKKPSVAKPAAGTRMDPMKGRFHQIHNRKLKMACDGCHSPETPDILFLRKDDVVPVSMPGQVDRSICLACHQDPAKPAWYGLK